MLRFVALLLHRSAPRLFSAGNAGYLCALLLEPALLWHLWNYGKHQRLEPMTNNTKHTPIPIVSCLATLFRLLIICNGRKVSTKQKGQYSIIEVLGPISLSSYSPTLINSGHITSKIRPKYLTMSLKNEVYPHSTRPPPQPPPPYHSTSDTER